MSSNVIPVERGRASQSEREMRVELAAAFRLAFRFGWSQLTWNHITARVPGEPDRFLINPIGLHWGEVTASKLIKVDADGNVVEGDGMVPKAGYVIHGAIHEARSDVNAVMHIHTNDGVAVSALKDGLQFITGESSFVYNRLGYVEFGVNLLEPSECDKLAAGLGNNRALILRNHGLLTVGKSVPEAFVLMYWLERACEIQMKVLASGAPYDVMPPEYAEVPEPRDDSEDFTPGRYEWPALLRLLDAQDPGYRE